MPRGMCRRHGREFGPCSCSLGKLSRLVEPQLLYLLARGEAQYGYDLMAHLRDAKLTDSEIDVAAVYRTLRTLEQSGCVVSHWEPGPGGPNRRMYEITPVGHQHLRDWAAVLNRRGAAMAEFAQDCAALT